jgi:hypothetical protein
MFFKRFSATKYLIEEKRKVFIENEINDGSSFRKRENRNGQFFDMF